MNRSQEILMQVKKAISGKDQVLLWMLTSMLAGGHILLEDMPGVGKTTAALAFSRTLGLDYGRVQFTPDVLPSDVTGFSVLDKESGRFRYQPGAVLCNLFLADELNRATSRTQSALLEAMEEGQVTVDGISHPLPQPFFVIATQNPAGASGTQLLPDSQIDRFTIRLSLGYPSPEAEAQMVKRRLAGNPLDAIKQVVTREELIGMQQEAASVYISDELIRYMIALIDASRSSELLSRGASPRATLAMVAMSRAVAYNSDRDFVIPGDIRMVYKQIIPHRLQLSQEAAARNLSAERVCEELLAQVKAPAV